MDGAARWEPDPTGKHDHRYWDGTRWTGHVADAGVASTDPYEPAVVSPDAPTGVTRIPGDDTATFPTVAAPVYVPPSPVPTGGVEPGAGRARRALVIGGAILAAVVLAVIGVVAFGDDDEPAGPLADGAVPTTGSTSTTQPETPSADGGEDELPGGFPDDEVDDLLQDAYGLTDEQARCLVDRIGDAMQDDEVDEEEALSSILEYFADCDISLEDIAGGGGD
ncbi:MAG: DUF2510 domain-containing protein [Acidimicrobiales bacterium]